ncbi:MAG: hypothetical protein DRP29_00465 [Thermodesulfobacteriota bacterium]|nr:MAG: hypothetical protein DRP29_00465 [Thermodesulfobacteriota bacterium]
MELINYLETLGILLLILSFLPIALYFYKKFNFKHLEGKHIKILEIKPINYKAQILLIEVEGKKYLIGLADKGFSYLGEIRNDSS